MKHSCFQYFIKRPKTTITLIVISFLLYFSYSYYHEYHTHIAGLTRRNTSSYDYSRSLNRLSRDKTWYHYESSALKLGARQDESHQIDDLISRIDDLKRIKLSISNELRLIAREKNKILKEKTALISKNDKLVSQINKSKVQLKQLELDISAGRKRKFEQSCDIGCVSPIVFNPLKSKDLESIYGVSKGLSHGLGRVSLAMDGQGYQFDFSRCPLTKEFKFHLKNFEPKNEYSTLFNNQRYRIELNLVKDILQSHRQHTSNISDACLVVNMLEINTELNLNHNYNNIIIDIIDSDTVTTGSRAHIWRAALASSNFYNDSYRSQMDIILPSVWQSPLDYNTIVGSIPSQSPIERKYLASYFGSGLSELSSLEKILQITHQNSIDDLFLFIYHCGHNSNVQCYEDKEKMIEMSTYLIILPETSIISHTTNDLIYLALSRGTVPVIVGKEITRLPFDEVIDWRRAALLINTARLPEIHFILRSISPSDLYNLKYHGRRIFENYLATAKQVLDTTISLISLERFNYPPPPVEDVKTWTYFSNKDQIFDTNCTSTACQEAATDSSLNGFMVAEILGPREKQLASQSYRRNFSLALSLTYDLWNNAMYSPLQLFPSYPVDPPAPSEFKFLSVNRAYRPIGDGLGGSGLELSRSIGGDYPNEQFTIVLLTYERKAILMKTLERLKGLAYLNKILVVWNNPKHIPSANLVWPDVGVPLLVVKVDRNSLNNRFLPYDSIETDAVLSLDDDSPLRQDEIVLAFRIWRQSRDRIVGFPGRYHAWDSNQNSWMYNSNHSCELSMVLTGGAFYHKYYSYIYSYSMPEAIRAIVDKFMNCEDIAMNFLVAHLSRKPPVKVTSRWTFHCAGCESSLSEDDSHFRERHECLNTFASIYGYMPLLSTQHRSDSILFKTRLPHDKQKCFRFV